MRSASAIVFLWTLAASLGLAAGPACAGRTDWRELAVGHFHLYSTVSDAKTRDFVRLLQNFEQAVVQVLHADSKLPEIPTFIYLLCDRDYNRYLAPQRGTGGLFHSRPFENILIVDTNTNSDFVATTILHEYTHYIQRNTSAMNFPPWYVEGYAELLSGSLIAKDRLVLGKLPNGVQITSRWIPVERILAVKLTDPEYRSENLMPQFYGESWALVHLLLFDDKARLEPTNCYLHALDERFKEEESFAACFPFDKKALDWRLRSLVDQHLIHLKIVALAQAVSVDTAEISRLTEAQADEQLARRVFLLGKPKDFALSLAAAALKESPTNPSMRALYARIAASEELPIDIADLAASVAAGGQFDAQSRIDLATALLARAPTATALQQAYAIVDPMVHDAAPQIEAVVLWCRAATGTGVEPSRVLSVLELASRRAPQNVLILQLMALAYEAMGDKPHARDCYNQIMLVSWNPVERLWAQKQSDSKRLQDGP